MPTLAQIKEQCRQRADMVHSSFVLDSELLGYINASIYELHDLLLQSFGDDYYVESIEFSTASGQLDYDLPNGTNYSAAPKFYKLKGLDIKAGNNQWSTVTKFNFNKRNQLANEFMTSTVHNNPVVQYRLLGDKVRLSRSVDGQASLRLWYHPVAQQLTLDTDSYDDINGYIEYIIIDTAIKMMQKEESDVSVLAAQKAAIIKRIVDSAANRDMSEPGFITDVYSGEDTDPTRIY